MIDLDQPSPHPDSLEKIRDESSTEVDDRLDIIAEQCPEVLGVAETLRRAMTEARHAFGLSGEPPFRGDEALVEYVTPVEGVYDPKANLEWLNESQASLSDEKSHSNDVMYFMDSVVRKVYNEAYDTLPNGVDIDALSDSFVKYVWPALRQDLGVVMPVGFGQRLLETTIDDAKESDEKIDAQLFVPQSDLITSDGIRAIGSGSVDTAAVFSYRSAEGSPSDRENMNRQSQGAMAYGESLRSLVEKAGPEQIYKTVEAAGKTAIDTLRQFQIEPSSWILDGAWALWDMGKRRYFADHPDEQQGHIDTELDQHMYSEALDYDKPGDAGQKLAERQIGWEVTQGPQSQWCIEVLDSLFDRDKTIDTGLKAKVEAKRNGEEVRFKSSELSLIGRLMLRNGKYDAVKAEN